MRDRTFDLHRAIVKEFRRVHPADDAEREFVMKFQITLKEAREALQLLRLLRDCCANRDRQLEALLDQCDQIMAILVASLKTAKRRDQEPRRR